MVLKSSMFLTVCFIVSTCMVASPSFAAKKKTILCTSDATTGKVVCAPPKKK